MGTVDKLGTAYTDKIICTGFGAHLALPMLRKALEDNPNINEKEARELVAKSMEVLFYRDARSFPKYQMAVMNEEGITVEGPLEVEQNWNVAHMIH